MVSFTLQLPASTVASADSNPLFGAPAQTKPGSASWRIFNPVATDNINWTSGTNYADGTAFNHTIAPETKFNFTGVDPVTITGVPAYKGFAFNDCSTGTMSAGSCATTSGKGGSTVVGKTDTASWTVTAGGKAGPLGTYSSTSSGSDPWTVTAADLDGLTGGYSLFFAVEFQSASFSSGGSVDFDVTYSTASGSIDLMDVALEPSGAFVFSPTVAGLSIYSLSSVNADPGTLSGTALSLAQLESIFQSDLSGNNLTTPIILGFLLNDLAIPTVDMGGGVLAQVAETATANDQGSAPGTVAPEPSTLSLFGCGTACFGLGCFLRKRRQ
jgi:hypothetical protein